MDNADKEIYLRVYNRVSDMLAIIECADKQADEYPATLLRELIIRERHAFNVEESNRREADKERQLAIEQQTQHKDD